MKTLGKWLIALIYATWCGIVLCLLIGEVDTNAQLNIVEFVVIKLMAICSLYAAYRLGAYCYRHQLFPPTMCGTKGGKA